MIQEIPEETKYFFLESVWKDYFRYKMEDMKMIRFGWEGEDKNLKAFNSKKEYIEWYCFHPKAPEPYRDFGFYTRELTALSNFMRPKVIVEIGTGLGAGTFLLYHLNPDAHLITIDRKRFQKAPENMVFQTGDLAIINGIPYNFIWGNSSSAIITKKFNLCFIDGDHSFAAVWEDSLWAWENKDEDNFVIIWHDFREDNPEFEGLRKAIKLFSEWANIDIHKLKDSSTAWCYRRSE